MKKLICCLIVLFLFCSSACAESVPFSSVRADKNYQITLKWKGRYYGPDDLYDYHVQQGCACDGSYIYLILENQVLHVGSVWKIDMETFKPVNIAYGLALDHGNDMTYNSKTGQLIVVHNKPNYNTVTFLDPDTLEVTGTRDLPFGIYCIGYNEAKDEYIVGYESGYDFAILNSDFEFIAEYKGINTGLVRQGCDCDENYIYFPQNKKDLTQVSVIVYDWDGNYVKTVPVKSHYEIESMCHTGEDWYIVFYSYTTVIRQSYLYKADMELLN